jgi:PAS domain S-box-containing protein
MSSFIEVPEEYRTDEVYQLIHEYLREYSNDGYWVWYIKDDYEYLSPRFKQILGFEDNEMENHPSGWMSLLEERDVNVLMAAVQQHFADGTPYDQVIRFRHKTKSHVWVHCRGQLLKRDENGAPSIMAGTHVDVTAIKDAEEQALELQSKLQAERDRLLRMNVNKTECIAKMNHELRTPLNVIMSFAQLCQLADGVTPEISEHVQWIYKSGKHMLDVINDLIDLSHMEISGVNSLNFEWISLIEILTAVVEMHQPVAREKGIVLTLQLASDGDVEILVDPVRIKQIFINLIMNAIKYNYKGGQVEVTVLHFVSTMQSNLDSVSVKIRDTGCGIPQERMQDIFTPFNDVAAAYDNAIKARAMKSSGIGLSLVKRMVELMGLTIDVKSIVAEGSTFTVSFPETKYRFHPTKRLSYAKTNRSIE